MTRIIAGVWGGRRLATPKGSGTRPTSDRVREALFATLASVLGGLDGLRVLDLFAGSGALGLEAASRGAAHVDLVEADRGAAAVITANVLGLEATVARVHRTTAERFLASAPDPYDLVMIDPPYESDVTSVLAAAATVLAPDGLVVVERSTRDALTWPSGLVAIRDKVYGDTRLHFGTVGA